MRGFKPKIVEVGKKSKAPLTLELGSVKKNPECDKCLKGGEKCECEND